MVLNAICLGMVGTEGWGGDWLVLLPVVLVCSIPNMHKFKKMTIMNFKLILLTKVHTNL